MILAEKTLVLLMMVMALLISWAFTAIQNAEIARIREHDQWLYQQNEELREKSSSAEPSTSQQETE